MDFSRVVLLGVILNVFYVLKECRAQTENQTDLTEQLEEQYGGWFLDSVLILIPFVGVSVLSIVGIVISVLAGFFGLLY